MSEFKNGDKVIFEILGNEVIEYSPWLESQNQSWIRHATPQEIQCGHRLPSVEILRDCDIPPNTIILER